MKVSLLSQLIVLFLITQFLGLAVGIQLIPQEEVRARMVTENPEDPINTIALMAYILIATGFMLVLIWFLKGFFLKLFFKVLESLAVLGTSFIVFGSFLTDLATVLILSFGLVFLRAIFPKHLILRNIASIIAVAGVGALIGVSFGVWPIIIFMVLLAFYDLIAVFKTKHMVVLAKSITKQNLSFTFALPTKEHTFELGTGDMVVPLTFAVSVLHATNPALPLFSRLIPSLLILFASLIGLLWTLNYGAKQVGRALPALPPQTIIMLLVFIVTYLFGFFN